VIGTCDDRRWIGDRHAMETCGGIGDRLANEGHRKAWQVRVPFLKCGRMIHALAVLGRDPEYNSRRLPAMVPR
jgi:hypothetical protein